MSVIDNRHKVYNVLLLSSFYLSGKYKYALKTCDDRHNMMAQLHVIQGSLSSKIFNNKIMISYFHGCYSRLYGLSFQLGFTEACAP